MSPAAGRGIRLKHRAQGMPTWRERQRDVTTDVPFLHAGHSSGELYHKAELTAASLRSGRKGRDWA